MPERGLRPRAGRSRRTRPLVEYSLDTDMELPAPPRETLAVATALVSWETTPRAGEWR